MSIFKADIAPKELERIEREIDKRIKERKAKYGDYLEKEDALARQVLKYHEIQMEDVPYELYMARKYARVFPEEEFGQPKRLGGIRRFLRRVVRRVIRPQIVYNEFITGAVDDLNQRITELEEKTKSLEAGARERRNEDRKK